MYSRVAEKTRRLSKTPDIRYALHCCNVRRRYVSRYHYAFLRREIAPAICTHRASDVDAIKLTLIATTTRLSQSSVATSFNNARDIVSRLNAPSSRAATLLTFVNKVCYVTKSHNATMTLPIK